MHHSTSNAIYFQTFYEEKEKIPFLNHHHRRRRQQHEAGKTAAHFRSVNMKNEVQTDM